MLALIPLLITILFGVWWYQRSRQSSINAAHVDGRERGFDNLVAFIDGFQYYLCRQNSGGQENRFTADELRESRAAGRRRYTRGKELLYKHIHHHKLIDPVIDYINDLYFPEHEADLVSQLPWPDEYEACRMFLFDAQRICDQLDRKWGASKKIAAEIKRQRQEIQRKIDRGIANKYRTTDGVTIMTMDGEAMATIGQRDYKMLGALEECQPICKARLDDWADRGI